MSPPIPAAELAEVLAGAAAYDALAGLNPQPICRHCHGDLTVRDVDLGSHAGCEPTTPPGKVPPPTLDVLSAALVDYEANSPRSLQVAVGPSEIGAPCDRRLGYRLRNAPARPGDGTVKWAPMLGTAAHAMNAEALTLANKRLGRERWLIENRVTPEPGISGSTDAYDTDFDIVCDYKLVGESTIVKAQRHGPGQQYEWQAHTYGRGWQRAGYDPKWVRIIFLPRWSSKISDGWEWTAPYSRLIADEALDRMARVAARLDALDVDQHPDRWAQVEATTSSSDCWFCNHRRASGAPADFLGCPGVRSKADTVVDDYLAGLPTVASP